MVERTQILMIQPNRFLSVRYRCVDILSSLTSDIILLRILLSYHIFLLYHCTVFLLYHNAYKLWQLDYFTTQFHELSHRSRVISWLMIAYVGVIILFKRKKDRICPSGFLDQTIWCFQMYALCLLLKYVTYAKKAWLPALVIVLDTPFSSVFHFMA